MASQHDVRLWFKYKRGIFSNMATQLAIETKSIIFLTHLQAEIGEVIFVLP